MSTHSSDSTVVNAEQAVFVALFLSAVAFLYVLVKCFTLSLINDECNLVSVIYDPAAYTISDIIGYKGFFCSANWHLFNSLFNHILAIWTGHKSILYTRCLNALLFIPYLWLAYQLVGLLISRHRQHYVLVYSGFISFFYLWDFFSIGRGYALALTAEMACLFLLVKYMHDFRWRTFYLGILAAVICVLANFSFFYFFASYLSLLFLIAARKQFQTHHRAGLIYLGLPVLPLLTLVIYYIYPISRQIIECDPYYYGTDTGFITGTLRSLLGTVDYNTDMPAFFSLIVKAVFAGFILLGTIVNLLRPNAKLNMVMLTVVPSILMLYAQFYVNHIKFPVDRTAMYLLPYAQLLFSLGISYLLYRPRLHSFIRPVIMMLLILHAVSAVSLNYTKAFMPCSNYKIVMERLRAVLLSVPDTGTIIVQDCLPPLAHTYLSLDTTIRSKHLIFLNTIEGEPSDSADFVIYGGFWGTIRNPYFHSDSVTVLYQDPRSHIILYKNKY